MSSSQHRKTPPQIFPAKDYTDTKKHQYQLGKKIGKGAFATVYKCQAVDTKEIYACKIVYLKLLKNQQYRNKLSSEIKLHHSMKHKNIIQLHKHIIDKNLVFMILELCPNGSLQDIIHQRKRLTEPEAALWFKQIVQTVKYLHGQRVIHRDLKLGNILLDINMNIKLCDFGLAAKLEYANQRRTTFCGTPNYIAPEILQKKHNRGHSYEVDIWSLGVLLYSLLCGKPPFETNKIQDTYDRIQHLKYRFPYNCQLSAPCKDIIRLILKNEPSERLTLDFMLIHSFLNGECPMPESIPITARFKVPTKEQLFPNGIGHGYHSKKASNSTLRTIINHNYAGNNVGNNVRFNVGNYAGNNVNNYGFRNAAEGKSESVDIANISHLLKSMTISNRNSVNFTLYIIDWIDYRKRYGIGYILSNGCTGIYFNDCTKILSKLESILYIDVNGKSTVFGKKQQPSHLMKKLTLLKHFESYLKSKLSGEQNAAIKNYQTLHMRGYGGEYGSGDVEYGGNCNDLYLHLFTSSHYAKLFVLSNNDVQIDFNDGTRIIACMKQRMVIYTNREQNQEIILLDDALNTNQPDLQKRMRHMKSILNKLLGGEQ